MCVSTTGQFVNKKNEDLYIENIWTKGETLNFYFLSAYCLIPCLFK